jgi:hypothetical protein
MTELTVLYLRDTGNVLAAITRADPSGRAQTVAELVGASLPLRFIDGGTPMALSLPAARLAAATVDDDPTVVQGPTDYGVVEKKEDGETKYQLTSQADSTGVVVVLRGSEVDITIPTAPITAARPVLVVLEKVVASPPRPATVIVSGSIPVGSQAVTLNAQLETGDWDTAAFVQGMTPYTTQETVT